MTTEEVEALCVGDEEHALIDVLAPDSFAERHIPGSVNAPLAAPDFVERVTEAVDGDKGTKVVLYCSDDSCAASEAAARRLEQAGFTNVFAYEEGIDGWESAGLELESGRTGY